MQAVKTGALILILAGVFVLGLVSGEMWTNKKCKVNVVSESRVLEVKVKNQKKLVNFVAKYLPCVGGAYALGDATTGMAVIGIKMAEIHISDDRQTLGVYKTEGEEKVQLASFGYQFELLNEKKARINLQFEKGYLEGEDLPEKLTYFIASRLDHLNKFERERMADWFDRKMTLDEFGDSADDAGLEFRVL